MNKSKTVIWSLCLALILFGGIGLGSLQSPQANSAQGKIDVTHFPEVEFSTPLPADPTERAKRQAKSKKYNNGKYSPTITESTDQIFVVSDWDLRLPAFPVAKSSSIIVCQVIAAHAYLSDDRTDIYSEFSVRVDQILKDDTQEPFTNGSTIVVERKGGRVRFPSGKTAVSLVNHQDMPRVGSRYVLFLTHNFPQGGQIESSYILTGYEFRAGQMFALDKIPGGPIAAYNGADEVLFLRDLQNALVTANPADPPK